MCLPAVCLSTGDLEVCLLTIYKLFPFDFCNKTDKTHYRHHIFLIMHVRRSHTYSYPYIFLFIAFNINHSISLPLMALNSLYCADVPLSNYSVTHSRSVENDTAVRYRSLLACLSNFFLLHIRLISST